MCFVCVDDVEWEELDWGDLGWVVAAGQRARGGAAVRARRRRSDPARATTSTVTPIRRRCSSCARHRRAMGRRGPQGQLTASGDIAVHPVRHGPRHLRALPADHHGRGDARRWVVDSAASPRTNSRPSTPFAASSRAASPTSAAPSTSGGSTPPNDRITETEPTKETPRSCTCQCTTGCGRSRSRSRWRASPAAATAASRSRASPTSTTPRTSASCSTDYKLSCWGAVTLTLGERNLCAKDEQQRAASVAVREGRRHDGQGARRPGDHDRARHRRQDRSRRHARARSGSGASTACKEVHELASASGVRIAIEPLNRFETYFVNRGDQALALADAVAPDVGVCLDAFHMNIEEVDLLEAIRDVGHAARRLPRRRQQPHGVRHGPARLAGDRRHAAGDRLRRRPHRGVRRPDRPHAGQPATPTRSRPTRSTSAPRSCSSSSTTAAACCRRASTTCSSSSAPTTLLPLI